VLGQDQIDNLIGRDVYGTDGGKIGTAVQVYADNETGNPEWVTVQTGLFGTKVSFVPLADASVSGEEITVPYDKGFVKSAPSIDEDGNLTQDEERELYAYYGRADYNTTTTAGTAAGTRAGGREETTAAAGSGQTGDRDGTVRDGTVQSRTGGGKGRKSAGRSTDDAMTVSEERLNVGTEQREAGRARLRKYVVTENVTQTVPVQREDVRVEREPITEANRDAAMSGSDISEDEHEVVVHEERPVVQKETVPVERVRLDTETVTEQETVGEEVRKERVDLEGDVSRTDRDRR
jgi:uncharacterized protein (TIGR02271 family)